MDSLTQIVLGAAVGEAVLGRKVGNKALLWGAIAGTIPDLDVITRFFVDDVTAAELHRGFSHSILFSLIFAPIFGWIISKIYKKKEADWKGWSKLMFWGFITHPLLDCHTTWGTQLFWPMKYRVAYNNIFVADPLYTIPFLICVIIVLFLNRKSKARRVINTVGLVLSSIYMLLTISFKWYTFQKFEENLELQNISYMELSTKPTPLNSLLWAGTVKRDTSFLTGYYSLLDTTDIIDFQTHLQNKRLLGKIKYEPDFKRLEYISKGFYVIEKEQDTLVFNDIRFGIMGLYRPPGDFVYKYKMYYENDSLKVLRKAPAVENLKSAFEVLIDRLKGK